jgi:hypothetical protein
MQLEDMVFFAAMVLMQCGLVSQLMAAFAALCMLKKRPIWTGTLNRQNGFNELQLM